MALVACGCGKSYSLPDADAGRTLQCPHCGQSLDVPFAAQPVLKIVPQADRAFDRDVFLLRQKHFSINEKYVVWDERAQPILFIERPRHHLRNLLAILGAIGALAVTGVALGYLTSIMPNELLQVICGIVTGVSALVGAMVVGVWLSPKRHVTFYRDKTKTERLLRVLQDRKWFWIVATYTVTDADGNLLARLSKNYLYNFFRKQWMCYDAKGFLLCVAKEDELLLAIMRRMFGPMLGLLRTNFIILHRDTELKLGEFNRNFTILDRYALDLRDDPERTLDRRIALAIGVMLDTGERR